MSKSHVIYHPEQFPAVIYYAPELEGASILIFANGKLVISGLKQKQLEIASQTVADLSTQI